MRNDSNVLYVKETKLPQWYNDILVKKINKYIKNSKQQEKSINAVLTLMNDTYPDIRNGSLIRIKIKRTKDSEPEWLSDLEGWNGIYYIFPESFREEPAVPPQKIERVRMLGTFFETVSFFNAFGRPQSRKFFDTVKSLETVSDISKGNIPQNVTIEPISFSEVVQYLLSAKMFYHNFVYPQFRNFQRRDGILMNQPDMILAYWSVAAAILGDKQEAENLIERAIRKNRLVVIDLMEDRAWHWFNRGIISLYQQGHKEAIPWFKRVYQTFPESVYAKEAKELTKDCTLTIQKKIQTPIDTIVNLASVQCMDPGGPVIFRTFCSDIEQPTDKIINMGPDMIPELIKALDDTRATRAIHWFRRFSKYRHVVRVSGAANAIIEMLIGIPFYSRSCTGCYLETETDEDRNKVKEKISAFWKEYGNGEKSIEWIKERITTSCNKTIFQNDRSNACYYTGDSEAIRYAIMKWGVKETGYFRMRPILKEIVEKGQWAFVHSAAKIMIENNDSELVIPIIKEFVDICKNNKNIKLNDNDCKITEALYKKQLSF